jgi:hypothetical protein
MHGLYAGNDLLAILVEHDAIPVREEVLLGGERRSFTWGPEPLVVGPVLQVGLGNADLRIGEIAAAVRRHDPANMIDMRMGGDDRIDVIGVDP